MTLKYKILLLVTLSLYPDFPRAQTFVHPGLLNSREDLSRMKDGVFRKSEPIYSGYKVFFDDPQSKYDYKMQGPLVTVGRNPTIGQGAYDSDANAAYQNAIMWCITGDKRYAEKAKEIINAWSATLKNISGKDAVLMAGLGPFKMINAAEIIRYTNAGWPEGDIRETERSFKKVVYPVLKNFAPFANGNWDSAALKTVMAIAIFCNDRPMYEKALLYYLDGDGDGAITHYIINDQGQCQESGRDQAHTQLGIAHLGDCCEMAWHQGLDLYGYDNNRLLKGFEYTAKFNLGYDVPYTPAMDRTGKYEHPLISPNARGRLRPIYEQIYNHFAVRMGLAAPYTQQAAEKIRPELKGQPGADHPGFGTLLYSIDANTSLVGAPHLPAIPGGIIALGTGSEIELNWIAVIGCQNYIVERAHAINGPYVVVSAFGIKNQYVDKHIKEGNLYYYRVIAINQNGRGAPSLPVAICAGLPEGWSCRSLDNLSDGTCSYDGMAYTLKVSGIADTDQSNNRLKGVFRVLAGDGEVKVRFNPPVASQFARLGLIVQGIYKGNHVSASVLITPQTTRDVEMPVWKIEFSMQQSGSKLPVIDQPLAEPYVQWGRLMEPYWLKLSRKGSAVTASVSGDGQSWKVIGSTPFPPGNKVLVGMAAAPGVDHISSKVQFDHVQITYLK